MSAHHHSWCARPQWHLLLYPYPLHTALGLWLLWGHCLNLLRTCPAPWWPLPEPPPWKYSIHLLGLLSGQRSLAQNSLPLKVNYPIRTPKLFPTPVHPLRSGRAAKLLQIEKLIVPLNLGWVFRNLRYSVLKLGKSQANQDQLESLFLCCTVSSDTSPQPGPVRPPPSD